jgi:hypothetical protein
MSYFVAISGQRATSLAPARGKLVPAVDAQAYFRESASIVAARTGGPVFLWDDGESDTSDDLVCEACDEIQLHGKSEPELAFARMLQACAAVGCSLHVWWPSQTSSIPDLPTASSVVEAIRLFISQASRGASIGFALHPNYVSKPTAGDGLQSFRLLPAGSGLTRR